MSAEKHTFSIVRAGKAYIKDALGQWVRIPTDFGAVSKWYSAAGVPSDTIGEDGDYYLNLTNDDIYKKVEDHWGTPIGNLKGEDGEPGEPGSAWFNGSGVPDPGVGDDGDYYLDTVTGNVYHKVGAAWGEAVGNIKGADGEPGLPGVTEEYVQNADGVADLYLSAGGPSTVGICPAVTKHMDCFAVALKYPTESGPVTGFITFGVFDAATGSMVKSLGDLDASTLTDTYAWYNVTPEVFEVTTDQIIGIHAGCGMICVRMNDQASYPDEGMYVGPTPVEMGLDTYRHHTSLGIAGASEDVSVINEEGPQDMMVMPGNFPRGIGFQHPHHMLSVSFPLKALTSNGGMAGSVVIGTFEKATGNLVTTLRTIDASELTDAFQWFDAPIVPEIFGVPLEHYVGVIVPVFTGGMVYMRGDWMPTYPGETFYQGSYPSQWGCYDSKRTQTSLGIPGVDAPLQETFVENSEGDWDPQTMGATGIGLEADVNLKDFAFALKYGQGTPLTGGIDFGIFERATGKMVKSLGVIDAATITDTFAWYTCPVTDQVTALDTDHYYGFIAGHAMPGMLCMRCKMPPGFYPGEAAYWGSALMGGAMDSKRTETLTGATGAEQLPRHGLISNEAGANPNPLSYGNSWGIGQEVDVNMTSIAFCLSVVDQGTTGSATVGVFSKADGTLVQAIAVLDLAVLTQEMVWKTFSAPAFTVTADQYFGIRLDDISGNHAYNFLNFRSRYCNYPGETVYSNYGPQLGTIGLDSRRIQVGEIGVQGPAAPATELVTHEGGTGYVFASMGTPVGIGFDDITILDNIAFALKYMGYPFTGLILFGIWDITNAPICVLIKELGFLDASTITDTYAWYQMPVIDEVFEVGPNQMVGIMGLDPTVMPAVRATTYQQGPYPGETYYNMGIPQTSQGLDSKRLQTNAGPTGASGEGVTEKVFVNETGGQVLTLGVGPYGINQAVTKNITSISFALKYETDPVTGSIIFGIFDKATGALVTTLRTMDAASLGSDWSWNGPVDGMYQVTAEQYIGVKGIDLSGNVSLRYRQNVGSEYIGEVAYAADAIIYGGIDSHRTETNLGLPGEQGEPGTPVSEDDLVEDIALWGG